METFRSDPNREKIFPVQTAVIVFWIDPVTTLSALKDPEVDKLTLGIKRRYYLGFVHELINPFDVFNEWQQFEVAMISRGLPISVPADGIEEDMCIPILPETYHPTGWTTPLQTTQPFPFGKDCYIHSHRSTARWRTQRDMRSAANATRISNSAKFDFRAGRDWTRRLKILREKSSRYAQDNSSSPKRTCQPRNDSVDDSDSDESSEEDGLEFAHDYIMTAMMKGGHVDELMVVCDGTYDLSIIEEFEDPSEYFKEEAYLQELIRQSKARALARAQLLDEEKFGTAMPSSNSEHAPPKQTLNNITESKMPSVLSNTATVGVSVKKTRRNLQTTYTSLKAVVANDVQRIKSRAARLFRTRQTLPSKPKTSHGDYWCADPLRAILGSIKIRL